MASKNYDKVKKYYATGIWNQKRVKDAVVKTWITEEEYKEITGEEYSE